MDLIQKIFGYLHVRGSHGIESPKWKRAEKRMYRNYGSHLVTMIRRGIKRERL